MNSKIRFLLGLLFACLYFSFAAFAQSQTNAGAISGVIADSASGAAIEFVTVALKQNGSEKILSGTITDTKGRFLFTNLPTGDYAVSVSFIGYRSKTLRSISVIAQQPEVWLGKIALAEEAANLKEVTVQALRPTITQEADKMVVSIEGTALAAGRTAFDVLATAPGVYVDHEGNIQLNGRSGITVMVDGKMTYLSARDLRNMLESMPADNLKNLEIIINPSARFDAQGSSGVLNINLKKNAQEGANGNVNSSYNTNGRQHGFGTGSTLNYKSGRWNSSLALNVGRRVVGRNSTFTRVFRSDNQSVYFDQVAEENVHSITLPSFRIGTDFSLTEKHSIGIKANYVSSKMNGNFLTSTYIGSLPNQSTQFIDARNYFSNIYNSITGNLHYQGNLDTLGRTLSADLDFVRITNEGEANFYNDYYRLDAGNALTEDKLYTSTPNGYNIYAAKTDYVHPLTTKHKLEMGAKASHVEADNDSRFYFNNNGLVLDPRRTNHFLYDENIYAAYLSWNSTLSDKIKLQAGLRAEQTQSVGESLTTGQRTRRSYLDLFPSVFLQQKVTENYSINYNYSHRINRPNYGSLNPFLSYRDPYTYWQGNPYLRPQYTHVAGITQVFKKTYNLVLNYQYNTDLIAELPAVDAATATTIYYIGNVDHAQNLSLTAIIPVKLSKKWEISNTFTSSYNQYSTIVENKQLLAHQTNYRLQSNHTILLPYKLKLELNGVYESRNVHALYTIEPRGWLNTGLKRSFLNEKLDVTLNMNDIFKSQDLIISANVGEGNVSDWDQYFRQRNFTVSVLYKFSSGVKFESQRQNTNLEEFNRAR